MKKTLAVVGSTSASRGEKDEMKGADEFWHHLSIVLSNSDEETVDDLDAKLGTPEFREALLSSFYDHSQPCRGGYSDERCLCNWSLKGFHILGALTHFDLHHEQLFPID